MTLLVDSVLDQLTRILQPGEISVKEADLEAYAVDWAGHRLPGRPRAVLRPATVRSVQLALQVANAAGVTVVPRGRGTGLSAAASAPDGALVLSTERLTEILNIEPDDEIAVVQPGVITADLDAAAAAHGLMFAPDPASHQLSSIGGNIATNAGGLHCVKYGVTRESVLGLTVVLADGSLLHTGHRTITGVAGYDLTALFVGSEGTLGVVVEATLRLRPRPVRTRMAVAFFPSVAAAASGVTAVVRSRVQPSMLELLDGPCWRAWTGPRAPTWRCAPAPCSWCRPTASAPTRRSPGSGRPCPLSARLSAGQSTTPTRPPPIITCGCAAAAVARCPTCGSSARTSPSPDPLWSPCSPPSSRSGADTALTPR